MCKRMQENGKLLGRHFCQHDKARHRNPRVMLQSLACHLPYSLPEYKKALVEQLSRNLGLEINDLEVGDLFELLFEEPLSNTGFTSLMVIDALDESEYQGRNELLDVIAKYFNKLSVWIRFLVTTRPAINITVSLSSLQPLMLESNDKENLIRLFFEQQFSNLSQGISVEDELGKELNIAEDQFFSFLNAITAAREPPPLNFVSKLLFPGTLSSAAKRKVNKAVVFIPSLFSVHDNCVHFFHKAVKDWLVDESLYGPHNFSVDENEGYCILSRLSIDEFNEVKRKSVGSSEKFSHKKNVS